MLSIQQPTLHQQTTKFPPSAKSSDLSIENQCQQPTEKPTTRHQIAINPPKNSQADSIKPPLTKKEEKEEEKKAAAAFS